MTGFADAFDVPAPDFHRGRYGRPLVLQVDGTEAEYLRPSQIGNHAKDSEGLIIWKARQVAKAVASARSWLRNRIVAEETGTRLDALIRDAINEVATEPSAADRGTSFHDAVQAGRSFDPVEETALDARARVLAAAGLDEVPELRERLVVSDHFRTAGRWDGVVRCPEGFEVEIPYGTTTRCWDLSGLLVVLDDKTGRNAVRFLKRGGASGGESATVQLTAYAHSDLYDPSTGVRTPVPGLSTTVGLIVHTDLDSGRTRLVWTLLDRRAAFACCTLSGWKPSLAVGGDSDDRPDQ